MKNKVYASFDEAVADVPDGATFMSGGFASIGVPRNLISALVRQGAKELTGISNNSGGQGEVVDVGKLVENGQIRKMVCAFTAAPHPSRAAMFEKLHEQGLVEAELVPQGTLVERMRAAGAGIGAFYTPTGVGTETAEGKEQRVINGRTYVLEYPLPADYAFVRAYRADTFGNLQFRRSQRNFNPIMAMAAKSPSPKSRKTFWSSARWTPTPFTRRASWWTGWSRFHRHRRASGTHRTGGRRGNQQSPRGRPPSTGSGRTVEWGLRANGRGKAQGQSAESAREAPFVWPQGERTV